jgi:hypothetical protein
MACLTYGCEDIVTVPTNPKQKCSNSMGVEDVCTQDQLCIVPTIQTPPLKARKSSNTLMPLVSQMARTTVPKKTLVSLWRKKNPPANPTFLTSFNAQTAGEVSRARKSVKGSVRLNNPLFANYISDVEQDPANNLRYKGCDCLDNDTADKGCQFNPGNSKERAEFAAVLRNLPKWTPESYSTVKIPTNQTLMTERMVGVPHNKIKMGAQASRVLLVLGVHQ